MPCAKIFRSLALLGLIGWVVPTQVEAAWSTVAGIKDGSESVSEPANPWDGERLISLGGTLNFAGSVTLDGELWLQPMNGWATPVVNIPGTLTMSAPASQFTVTGGADLNVGNAAGSFVEAGKVTIFSGSQVTLGNFIAHDDLHLRDAGSSLQLLGSYTQDGGMFFVEGNTSFQAAGAVAVDSDEFFSVNGPFSAGTLTKAGLGDFGVSTPNFTISNSAASSVEAGRITLTAGQLITLGQVAAHDNVDIRHTGTKLNVLGDYQQDGGSFALIFEGAFDVDGKFTKTGNGEFTIGTPNFTIGNPAASSVEAGRINLTAGQLITLGQVTAHDNVDIRHAGTKLNVLGDYQQDGGSFALIFEGAFDVDGKFTKTGSGEFSIGAPSFTIGNPAASTVEAGRINLTAGQPITLAQVTAHDNVDIRHTGTKLNVLGDYQQDGGSFALIFEGAFDVDGKFTKTGSGEFSIGAPSFTIGNPAASTVEAGRINLTAGQPITLAQVTAHDNVDIRHAGTKLNVLGDYQQDGGSFALIFEGAFDVDGKFTKTGSGEFSIGAPNFTIGDPAASTVEAGRINLTAGQPITLAQVTAHDNVDIRHAGTKLNVLGDYQQDAGSFALIFEGAIDVDGKFTKSGTGAFIVGGTTFTVGNSAASSVEAGEVVVVGGSQVTLGQVTAHGNVLIENAGSRLNSLGDYLQDGGDLRIIGGSTLQIGGKITKSGTGAFIVGGTTFTVANPAASSLEAGEVVVVGGSQVTLGQVTAHNHVRIENTGSRLTVLNNFVQDGGDFRVFGSGAFTSTAPFTFASSGVFNLHNSNFTAGVTELASATIEGAAQASTLALSLNGTAVVAQAGTTLAVQGAYTQDAGNLHVIDSATMTVSGAFNYTAGNTIEVRNNATLNSSATGSSTTNFVSVHSGGKATIGALTAHGDVNVNNPTSLLRVGGDYLQDAGGFTVGDIAILNVEGSFRYNVPGSRFLNFGNGLLRVGNTLTIEEGHFWNLAASGGKVRVGTGLAAPAAGSAILSAGGTLKGNGTIIGSVTNSAGTLAPGLSVGRLDVASSYVQGAAAGLVIEIGGTFPELQFDQLFISGTANLGGSLTVQLVDLGSGIFSPTVGQTFEILKAGAGRTGMFATANLPLLGAGRAWQISYLPNIVELSVVAAAILPGDYDADGDVDAGDYTRWQQQFGTIVAASTGADGNGNGVVDAADYTVWRDNVTNSAASSSALISAVPEPAAVLLTLFAWTGFLIRARQFPTIARKLPMR